MKEAMALPFPLIDETIGEKHTEQVPTKQNTKPLPEKFGRNLDTLEKARQWLINPHNWHGGSLFILKWDGLLCTIKKEHALKLIDNPQDMGLPWCVMSAQAKRKSKKDRGESMDDQVSLPSGVEPEDG
jgi:hypothetical protein